MYPSIYPIYLSYLSIYLSILSFLSFLSILSFQSILSIVVSLSVFAYLCLFRCLCLSLCLFRSLTDSLSLSLSLSLICIYVSYSVSLSIYLSLFVYLSLSQAALAAVIMFSINGLLSFSDIWEAFKHNKKDCLVTVITLVVTFVFQTSIGLAVGKCCIMKWSEVKLC